MIATVLAVINALLTMASRILVRTVAALFLIALMAIALILAVVGLLLNAAT